jgi:hypothetical protein
MVEDMVKEKSDPIRSVYTPSGAQSFNPKFWWHGRVNEKSTDNIVEGAKRAFCFSVLRRGI